MMLGLVWPSEKNQAEIKAEVECDGNSESCRKTFAGVVENQRA